jgi:hypothetical protein
MLEDDAPRAGAGRVRKRRARPVHVDPLKKYIANQEEHNKKESFQDEFRRLCSKYGVEIDERYVWD